MQLEEISRTLLNEESSEKELIAALDAFATLCSNISGIEAELCYTAWSEDAHTSNGVAIDPKAAAYCVKDYRRSIAFIRGTYAALKSLAQSSTRDTPIRILYAGCGPYATILLPLLPLFDSNQFSIQLLDIHQTSLDSVALLLKANNLHHYDVTLVCADACEYKAASTFDLVLLEVMQKALEQEPQVAATQNLVTQLAPAGYLIPKLIEVDLCLVNSDAVASRASRHTPLGYFDYEKEAFIIKLKRLIALSLEDTLQQARTNERAETSVLLLGSIKIPEIDNLHLFSPALFTRIQIFEHYCLEYYDSSLSLPSPCSELEPLTVGQKFQASYSMSAYPKINWSRL